MVHTITVIAAEAPQREEISTALKEKLAYRIVSLPGGKEAVHHFATEQSAQTDVILFDAASVPDSCECIAKIKTLSPQTPVLCLVKYGDYETALKAMNAGAQDFLAKPVTIERLSTTLRNLLQLRDARRELERLRRSHAGGTHADSRKALAAPESSDVFVAEDGHIRAMEMIEAEVIRFAMTHYNGRMTEVARRLGIGRSTLYRKLNELAQRAQESATQVA